MRLSESKECLLNEEADIGSSEQYAKRPQEACRSCRRHARTTTMFRTYVCILHTLVFLLFMLCFYLSRDCKSSPLGYKPIAQELASMMHLHADTSMTSHTSSSIYSGSPTEENNKAWDNLILPLYFNASGSEVSSSFPGSVPEDYIKVVGWGYLASLEVYHQLHCLRQLRMWTFKESFYPALSPADAEFLQDHLGHCIESLRASTMCDPSLQVNVFRWKDVNTMQSQKPTKPFEPVLQSRKCVNWRAIDGWARKRSISLTPKLLKPVITDEE